MNDLHDLQIILRSRFPLVVIESHEEPKVLALIERLARAEDQALFVWSVADGLRRRGFSYQSGHRDRDEAWGYADGYRPQAREPGAGAREHAVDGTQSLTEVLHYIDRTSERGLFLLCDPHPFLDDPVNQRLLKEIAHGFNDAARTLVLLSPQLELPQDIARHAARFAIAVPGLERIRELLKTELELYQQSEGRRVTGDQDTAALLIQHLAGLCEEDVKRLIRMAIRDDGALTRSDITRVLKTKREMLAGAALELEVDQGSFADIGGMRRLKAWLELRRPVFLGEAGAGALDAPKGVLLLGVQGAGKSLAAKTVAGAWGVPLLRLDFASLHNKFHGETERNLREALRTAETMAPCVLWMDEIEKGLAADGGEADGGVGRRVLGTLLTWMAERRQRVFMVATANDIARLPPELMRKGRFDEIFFVDLPDPAARADILRIHLTRRGHDPADFALAELAGATEGYSGAELEQVIVGALYEAHARSQPLSLAMLRDEAQRTRPLSVVMAEKVNALRAWAAERTVAAD